MDYSKRNDTLFIDEEALSTLAIVQEGLLYPVTKLMGKEEAQEVDKSKRYKNLPMPFSFILSPQGKRNQQNIKKFKKGDKVTLVCNNKKVGEVIVDEVFDIDINERLKNIYGSDDLSIPVINRAHKRLGKYAISGEYKVDYPPIKKSIELVKRKIKESNAKVVTGMVLGANPLTRAQERVIRESISESDLMIIFLIKPFINEGLSYEIRKRTVD
ncbi:MAG: sulfate adenylyltransferase, partial [Epsilonproteobacteria bacterium]|nr:sulfate adenylyltransferase [Campylobacterota bacterium]